MSSVLQSKPKEAIKHPYLSIEESTTLNESVPVIKSRRTGNSYSSLSVYEALKSYASITSSKGIKTSNPFGWIEMGTVFLKPKKELTEKQLFSKIKKELKEVVNRTSAI